MYPLTFIQVTCDDCGHSREAQFTYADEPTSVVGSLVHKFYTEHIVGRHDVRRPEIRVEYKNQCRERILITGKTGEYYCDLWEGHSGYHRIGAI